MRTELGSIKSEIENMKNEVGSFKSDVGNLKSDLGNLKSDVGNIKEKVSAVQADAIIQKDMIVSLSKDIYSAKNFIAGIVVVTGTLAAIAQIKQSKDAIKSSQKMEENISKMDNIPIKQLFLLFYLS